MQNQTLNAGSDAPQLEAAAPAGRYWLEKHVHVCVSHGHVVMLDVKRDKYLAVRAPEVLAPWVDGWPVAPRPIDETHSIGGERGSASDSETPALLRRLVRDGLLTPDPARGKSAKLTQIPRPCSALVHFEFGIRPRMKPTHTIVVGKAWLTARKAVKRLSLQHLVERVQERKARAPNRYWDVHRVRELVTAFLWLRPLYYSPRDACLLDSVVLLELLAQREIFPMWVFGIKLAPFSAHCWIQDNDIVCNDVPERVGSYTPILCI